MPHDPSETQLSSSSRKIIWLGWGAVFAVTAIAATWPLVLSITTAIPIGWEKVATVPLLNLWTVWWNADRAAVGFTGYWDAPIFYPADSTFVFSEAQPTTLVVAPLVWFQGDAILAYNVYLLITLWLNGLLTFRLLSEQNYTAWSAGVAGIVTQIIPYAAWQLGVLQLTQLWPSLWTMACALKLMRAPTWRTALELGLAYAITYASCNYHGLFLAVLLPFAGLWGLNRQWLKFSSWLKVLLAAVVAGGLLAPIVTEQLAQSRAHHWQRDDVTVRNLSAKWRDYTDTPSYQWLESWEDEASVRHELWPLGPGWLKLIAAACGLILGLLLPGYRRWTIVVMTFGLLAVWYSLGPEFAVWNISPYGLLREHVPGFGQIRSPFRFALFVQLAVTWLAALLIERLIPRVRVQPPDVSAEDAWLVDAGLIATTPQPPQRGFFWLRWSSAVVIGICLIAETRPLYQPLHVLSLHDPLPPWVEYVREELPAGVPIACLPMSFGTAVDDYETETQWMIWGLIHKHPILNGYSGYFPTEYVTLKDELIKFPDQGAPGLVKLRARYVVVRRDFETEDTISAHPATRGWVWLFGDEQQQIDIYRLPENIPAESSQSAKPSQSAD